MCVSPRIPADSGSHLISRRSALRAVLATTLLLGHLPDATRAGSTQSVPSAMVGETFVGRTSDPTLFIAIVLSEQHVMAYLCDGSRGQISVWFQGEVQNDHVDVTAADGARLTGLRTAAGISGGGSLPDGRGIRFLAEPAAGFGGLYAVRVHADGRIHGDASTHGVLDGTVMRSRPTAESVTSLDTSDDEQITGNASRPEVAPGARFAAQITQPDGHKLPIQVRTASVDPGQYWVIVLADGAARGDGITIISGMGLRAE